MRLRFRRYWFLAGFWAVLLLVVTVVAANSPEFPIPRGFVSLALPADLERIADVPAGMGGVLFDGADSVAVKLDGRRPLAFMRVSVLDGASAVEASTSKLVAGAKAQPTARIRSEEVLEVAGVPCASVVWARGQGTTETTIQQVAVPISEARTVLFSLNAAPAVFEAERGAFEAALRTFSGAQAPSQSVSGWVSALFSIILLGALWVWHFRRSPDR